MRGCVEQFAETFRQRSARFVFGDRKQSRLALHGYEKQQKSAKWFVRHPLLLSLHLHTHTHPQHKFTLTLDLLFPQHCCLAFHRRLINAHSRLLNESPFINQHSMAHNHNTLHGRGYTDDLNQGLEHSRLLRQRRQAPETEDDLLALQDEFYKGTDRTAATAVRVTRPPTIGTAPQVTSSSTQPSTSISTRTTVEDDDDDGDIPPPLEKDVVSLGDTELPARPPTIQHAPPSKLRPGSRFLQDRANKGPRTHFPGGERFEIDLDEDEHEQHGHEVPVETEEETRKRLNAIGASMGQILHEVLEKPVAEAVAPTGPTTALGSLAPAPGATKPGKGKSLFAQRLAQAQGKAPASSPAPYGGNSNIPSSAAYASLTSRPASASKDVVTIPDPRMYSCSCAREKK